MLWLGTRFLFFKLCGSKVIWLDQSPASTCTYTPTSLINCNSSTNFSTILIRSRSPDPRDLRRQEPKTESNSKTKQEYHDKHHFDCAFGGHSHHNHGSDISHNHTHNNTFSHSCKHHCTHKDDDTVATTTTTSEITIPQQRQRHDLKHARAQKPRQKRQPQTCDHYSEHANLSFLSPCFFTPHSSHNTGRPNTSTERLRGRPCHDEQVPTPRDLDVSFKCRFP